MTMKKSSAWMMAGLCGLLCALTACASASSVVKPNYDFRTVGRVAVLIQSSVGSPAQQRQIADLFAMHILSKGYDVIDRANLSDLVNEAEFQNTSGITSPEGRAKLAIRNVSAVIVTNVSEIGDEISLTAKMMDVQSGTLLWSGEGTGKLEEWLAPVGGALVGGGAGAAVGSMIGNTPGAVIGGIAGAAAGGVAGAALTPSDAQLLRKVVAKTCKGLPSLVPAP